MAANFTFLQPTLHQPDVKTYLDTQFLDASSYIHDILLNSIAMRTFDTTKAACDESEDLHRSRLFHASTNVCLRVSVNSINLIRQDDEPIDDRLIMISNFDPPELLVYMASDRTRDILMLTCGTVLLVCGLLSSYFLKDLLPILCTTGDLRR